MKTSIAKILESIKATLVFIIAIRGIAYGQTNLNFTLTSVGNSYTLTCSKTTLTISVSANTGNSIVCTWNSLSNGTLTGNPVSISNPDSYTVSVQDLITSEIASQTLTVLQDTIPPSASSPSAILTITCPTIDWMYSLNLTPTFSTPTSDYLFAWSSNTVGILSPSNQATLVISTAGLYTCIVTNSVNGCSTKTTFTVSCYVGFKENYVNNPFIKLEPNPFSDKLVLIWDDLNSIKENALIIRDLGGRIIVYSRIYVIRTELELSDLPNGIYFLELFQADNVNYRQKIIKKG